MINNQHYTAATAKRLSVERAWIYRPQSAWLYSHHPSLTFFNGRYYAIWSKGRRDEDAPGQRVLVASSEDVLNWSEPVPLFDTMSGEYGERVLTSAGFHQHDGQVVAYAGAYEYRPECLDENGQRRPGDKGHMNTSLLAMTSRDGSNWTIPIDLGLPVVPNHGPQRTRSGRLIISGNISFPYTDDPCGLRDWHLTGVYPDAVAEKVVDDSEGFWQVQAVAGWPNGLCEGSFFQTDDGILHMLLRINQPGDSIIYRSAMNPKIQRNFQVFSPCDFIAAITQHIPDKSFQLVRYYGWYSNRMRGQRDKHAAEEAQAAAGNAVTIIDVSEYKPRRIPFAKWRELIKKVWEADPLLCPRCSKEMRIVSLTPGRPGLPRPARSVPPRTSSRLHPAFATVSPVKMILQAGSGRRVPAPTEKRFLISFSFALALLSMLTYASRATADVALDIEQLMGARTKIVWLRSYDWEELHQAQGASEAIDTTRFETGFDSPDTAKRNTVVRPGAPVDGGGASLYQPLIGHIFDKRGAFVVMFYDTAEKKERELTPVGWHFNPLISPDGTQVIYSTGIPPWKGPGRKICVINTDGNRQRILRDGFAQWIWKDPASGKVWIYYSDENTPGISRMLLDDPSVVEKIYSGNISNRFSVSADGMQAAAEFPWPQAGMLDLATGKLTTQGYPQGCNTYMAPDNSHRISVLTGSHTEVIVLQPDGTRTQFSIAPPTMQTLKGGGKGVLWNPKWAADSQHFVACGPFKNLASDRADVWLGDYAPDYKSVKQWVQVTDSDVMDTYAYVWVATDLGAFTGEAPYALAIPLFKEGDWAWTFGDGATATGLHGKHTYTNAGKYTITARLNGTVKTGVVEVLPRVAPTITAVIVVDDHHLLVNFSEPVQGKMMRVTLRSGATVKASTWNSDGRSLLIETAKTLPARDALQLHGITDTAQTPNPLATAPVAMASSAWPSNRSGLAYLWETRLRPSYLFLDGQVKTTAVVGGGNARFTRFGGMLLKGNAFSNNEASYAGAVAIPALCNTSHAISLESTIQAMSLAQGKETPLSIITLPDGFTLAQQENKLFFTLTTSARGKPAAQQTALLGMLPDTAPHHVVVTYSNGKLVSYLDGKKMAASTTIITGDPAMTVTKPLLFGDHGWQGKLEGVAIYHRVLPATEVNANALAYRRVLNNRKTPEQITVQAKLTTITPIPRAADIVPYRNALVVNEYTVEKVIKGSYKPASLRVAQWGLLDGKETPLASLQAGTSITLTLEAYSDHPEVEPELLKNTLLENYDLTLYVEAE